MKLLMYKTYGVWLALMVGLLAPGVRADDANTTMQATGVFDTRVVFPVPSWFEKEFTRGDFELFHQANEKYVIFEQIPKGETFESWTQMLAVGGQPRKSIEFDSYAGQSIGVFAQGCGGFEKLTYQSLFDGKDGAGNGVKLMLVLCPSTVNGPAKFGYGEDVGEVTLMFFSHSQGALIKVYHHWRGDAFSMQDRASWPVTDRTIRMTIDRFKKIRLQPLQ